jgi:hypothetical protein
MALRVPSHNDHPPPIRQKEEAPAARPKLRQTEPGGEGSKKKAQGRRALGLPLHVPPDGFRAKSRYPKKVDNRGRTKGAMKDKNILLHSCHELGVDQCM